CDHSMAESLCKVQSSSRMSILKPGRGKLSPIQNIVGNVLEHGCRSGSHRLLQSWTSWQHVVLNLYQLYSVLRCVLIVSQYYCNMCTYKAHLRSGAHVTICR